MQRPVPARGASRMHDAGRCPAGRDAFDAWCPAVAMHRMHDARRCTAASMHSMHGARPERRHRPCIRCMACIVCSLAAQPPLCSSLAAAAALLARATRSSAPQQLSPAPPQPRDSQLGPTQPLSRYSPQLGPSQLLVHEDRLLRRLADERRPPLSACDVPGALRYARRVERHQAADAAAADNRVRGAEPTMCALTSS